MCTRHSQLAMWDWLRKRYGIRHPPPNDWTPRYNGALKQRHLVVRRDRETGEHRAELMQWSLVPHWSKEPKVKFATHNARCETVATSAAFREPFRKGRRCIVPVTGFYEWKEIDGLKQPYFISARDCDPLSFAGLWEGWQDRTSGEWLHTYTIVTGEPNELIGEIHDRMPVILDEAGAAAWLGDVPATIEDLDAIMKSPYPGERMQYWPVDRAVNKVGVERPGLSDPIELVPAEALV